MEKKRIKTNSCHTGRGRGCWHC